MILFKISIYTKNNIIFLKMSYHKEYSSDDDSLHGTCYISKYRERRKSMSNIDYQSLKNKKKNIKTFHFSFQKLKKFDYTMNDDIEKESLKNSVLLNAINIIASNKNLHFGSLFQAVENFDKIIMYLFKDDFSAKVEIKELLTHCDTAEEAISDITNFLSYKYRKFQYLNLDFTSEDFIDSSASLLYSTCLNFLFLKKTKRELFERCATILYVKSKNYDEILQNEINILTNIMTYKSLIYFIKEGESNLIPKNIKALPKSYFKSTSVPLIVNKKFLDNCSKDNDLPLEIYFQLQFILNALDSGKNRPRFIEFFLVIIKKIKKIKVPPFDVLVSNIRSINISKILQRNSYNQAVKQNKIKEEKIEREGDYDHYFGDLFEDAFRRNALPELKTFSERHNEKRQHYFNVNKSQSDEFEDEEIFWNREKHNFVFKNGILFNKKNDQSKYTKKWKDSIDLLLHQSINSDKNVNKDSKVQFNSISKRDIIEKLYKIFYYDEISNQWRYDNEEFTNLSKDKHINHRDAKTPIILFTNSNEEDLISINSNIINGSYPYLDDENIYVYALCSKSLSVLSFYVDFLSKEKSSIKPIFLLLHVPKNKRKLHNIKLIIYQIYAFLSFISDIEIVVLNKSYYNDQIELIRTVHNIKNSFQKLNENEVITSVQEEVNDNDDYDFSDDEERLIQRFNLRKFQNQDIKPYCDIFLVKINDNVFQKKSKTIFLINDEKVALDNQNVIENDKNFSKICSQFKDSICKVHFINAKNADTYEGFLSSLTKLSIDKCTLYSDLHYNFHAVRLTDFSSAYVILKKLDDYKKELFEMLDQRFQTIKQYNQHDDALNNILKLKKEIVKIYPPLDKKFLSDCNEILTEIHKNQGKKDRKFIKDELKESSKQKLDYLDIMINNEYTWSEEQRENIKISHIQFLKDEFFSILEDKFSSDVISVNYEENINILDKQVNKDTQKIVKIFNDFDKKLHLKKKKQLEIDYLIQKGTNYCIREEENERELKVRVEIGGNLEDLIPQDF